MAEQPNDGILEEFRVEFLDCWQRVPNKGFFLLLLVVWLALFQFLGNSALGYIRTNSLFLWTYGAFTSGGRENVLKADEGYAVFVPLLVLVLFWFKRRELIALELRTWWPGLLLLGLGIVLHLLGYRVQQTRVSIIGLFTGIYGLMGLAWGPAWLRKSFFPFFLLLFCIPLGSALIPLTFRLQILVCQLVEFIAHYILFIDVERQGTQLIDPTGHYKYEVAAACSGIRSLPAIVAFGLVLGFLSCRKWWKRLAMVAAAVPLAVAGNLLRMMAIVIAAEIGGQELGNQVHEGGPGGIFVLMLYVPAFAGLLVLEHYLRDPAPRPAPQILEAQAA